MIDPTDLLGVFRDGDEGVLPTPTGGEFGDDASAENSEIPSARPAPIARVFDLSIATLETTTVNDRDRPDYWVVALSSTANGLLRVWPAEAPAGQPYRLEPGGELVIPGTSRYLTLTADGAASLHTVTVVAVRGFEGVRVRYAK